MCSCWQDNPDNRPTFETLYVRFDEFMIQAEPSYREVNNLSFKIDHYFIQIIYYGLKAFFSSFFLSVNIKIK